jgi:hypothetical protein
MDEAGRFFLQALDVITASCQLLLVDAKRVLEHCASVVTGYSEFYFCEFKDGSLPELLWWLEVDRTDGTTPVWSMSAGWEGNGWRFSAGCYRADRDGPTPQELREERLCTSLSGFLVELRGVAAWLDQRARGVSDLPPADASGGVPEGEPDAGCRAVAAGFAALGRSARRLGVAIPPPPWVPGGKPAPPECPTDCRVDPQTGSPVLGWWDSMRLADGERVVWRGELGVADGLWQVEAGCYRDTAAGRVPVALRAPGRCAGFEEMLTELDAATTWLIEHAQQFRIDQQGRGPAQISMETE